MRSKDPSPRGTLRRAFSITTRQGDGGRTRLWSGEEVPKYDDRVECLGTVDELVSVLGIARAWSATPTTRRAIRNLQTTLFVIGSEIAASPRWSDALPVRLSAREVQRLDARRRRLERRLDPTGGFVLPGVHTVAAHLDHARAVARRLERLVAKLFDHAQVTNPHILVWLNRLSDYLWLLARMEEKTPDVLPPRRRRRRP